MTFRITSLMENTKSGDGFACEHGLSVLVEWRDKTYLIDIGASDQFLGNAQALGKDLSKVDYVVLSHGHSDHSGGFRALCQATKKAFQLVLNLHFFDKKFKRDGAYLRYIGNDFDEEFLQTENIATVFPMTDTFTLLDGVHILSGIPMSTPYEAQAHDFVALRGGKYEDDLFEDEQVLIFDLPQGLVAMVGCAHKGVVNICEAAKQRLGKPVYAVVGGLHLMDSNDTRIEKTAAYLQEEGIRLVTGHCTGEKGMLCLEAACQEMYALSAGSVIEFPDED